VTEDILSYARGAERLVQAVQELSTARDMTAIMAIVRRAARDLSGADGATFVLRDGDQCLYADEDAIAPLWKGARFPLESCLSGWAMLHGEAVVLEDVYADPRAPADVYRPTFVNSLVMVPIRRLDPVGAIGNYWATRHRPSEATVRLLQALADSTSIAMQNVELVASLESRVAERTAQLEATNRELEAFSYTVSHDLRAPLRTITAFSQALLEDHAGRLGAGKQDLDRICAAAARMTILIDDLLQLSRAGRRELVRAPFDIAKHVREIVEELRRADPGRSVEIICPATLPAHGDTRLVRVVLENLVRNAWKFTSKRPAARIEIGGSNGAYFVRDDGAGFDPGKADKLFQPFQRLHSTDDFEGTGIGLATALRIVARHDGRIWATSAPGQGATFRFTLG
jgi:signal transduction histidine kinase